MGKIRILEAIRQGSIGGGESHVLDLVRNLDKSMFEPVVLSFTDGQMVDKLNEMKVKNYVLHTERPFDFRIWKKVKKLIKDEKIDLIHAHGTRAASNTFSSAKNLNIPFVYTVHGWSFHPDQSFIKKKLRIQGEQLITKLANLSISVSQSNKETGQKLIGDFESEVIKNGVDQDKFSPARRYNNIREELGIAKDVTLIGFISRMTKQKQPLALIRAFNTIAEKYDNLKLLMVGDGDLKQEAEELVAQLKLKDKIILQGFRTDVPDILHAIDVYCLPSLWEGLPLGLLEAMSMQKAVIASEVDGSLEIIKDGENGILIPPGNELELAIAMEALHLDDKKREQLGVAAKQSVLEDHNVQKMTKRVEDVYKKLYSSNN